MKTAFATLLAWSLGFVAAVGHASPWPAPSTTMEEFLTPLGIPLERHWVMQSSTPDCALLKPCGREVETRDGYILGLHRLPQPKKGAKVVFLQHGILASSWCWLINTESRATGVQLWKQGCATLTLGANGRHERAPFTFHDATVVAGTTCGWETLVATLTPATTLR
jgi:hypothetical protein